LPEEQNSAGISHSVSDIPLRRGAFKQASERLQIIANHSKYQRGHNGVVNTGLGLAVYGPTQKKLKLKKGEIVLTNNSMPNLDDGVAINIENNAVLRVVKGEKNNSTKSDFDIVCSGIQKVALESPPINSTKRCTRSTSLRMDDTCSDLFICDICKLDFLKLDELRNHIEQDHFAPTY
jgi:hypothetical protein